MLAVSIAAIAAVDTAMSTNATLAMLRQIGATAERCHHIVRMADEWSHEETDDPLYADDRNFYKLEKWTKDGSKVDRLL